MAAAKKAASAKPKSESKSKDQLTVTAPLVQVSTDDGKSLHLYKGDIVPSSVTDETVENLKSLGFVTGDEPVAEPELTDDDN